MNPKLHYCPQCGYEWQHGADGTHSCAKELQELARFFYHLLLASPGALLDLDASPIIRAYWPWLEAVVVGPEGLRVRSRFPALLVQKGSFASSIWEESDQTTDEFTVIGPDADLLKAVLKDREKLQRAMRGVVRQVRSTDPVVQQRNPNQSDSRFDMDVVRSKFQQMERSLSEAHQRLKNHSLLLEELGNIGSELFDLSKKFQQLWNHVAKLDDSLEEEDFGENDSPRAMGWVDDKGSP